MINHGKPTVTIFADASVYPNHRAAGWACWIRADGMDTRWNNGAAPFTNRKSCVNDAETYALVRAVMFASEEYLITPETKHILLQSDSLSALRYFWYALDNCHAVRSSDARIPGPSKPNRHSADFIREVWTTLKRMDVVYLKHVKGHQNGVHARSWVNERCDQLAKEAAKACR